MKKRLIEISLIFIDAILINLAIFIAFYIRFEGDLDSLAVQNYFALYLQTFLPITIIKLFIFYLMGLYKSLWKYASIEELLQIVFASIVANTAVVTYMFIIRGAFPRSVYILLFILDILLIGGLRFSVRLRRSIRGYKLLHLGRKPGMKRVMIIGGGEAGAMIIKELRKHEGLKSNPVAIIDDDRSKTGSNINGVPVMGNRSQIIRVAESKGIDEIIIAIPSAPRSEIKDIVEECSKTKCRLKILPGIFELIDGKVSIKMIRDVDIEDLLGREPVNVDLKEISDYLTNKVIMVTGGGGSIGSELCRQIAKFRPKKLLILDNYENSAFDLEIELSAKFHDLDFEVIIASVRDGDRMEEVFSKWKPHIVFHSAAHKHVPLMENNPKEAIKNNVLGTRIVAECTHKYGVRRFVLISTDKAVNPSNIMGASKRVAEMIVQAMDSMSETEFVAVRFGNVLGSNGSVIPIFRKQILAGGPITVTHPDITRYFMTIPEAVQLVIQAGTMARGGEVFVLDMGVPVKIIDLARNLIKLSGLEPDRDIKIEIVGLRPGEKLYEELLMKEESLKSTKHEKIFIGKPMFKDLEQLNSEIDILLSKDGKEIRECMEKIVPTYKRSIFI